MIGPSVRVRVVHPAVRRSRRIASSFQYVRARVHSISGALVYTESFLRGTAPGAAARSGALRPTRAERDPEAGSVNTETASYRQRTVFIRRRRYRSARRRCTGASHHTECCQCRRRRPAWGSLTWPPRRKQFVRWSRERTLNRRSTGQNRRHTTASRRCTCTLPRRRHGLGAPVSRSRPRLFHAHSPCCQADGGRR